MRISQVFCVRICIDGWFDAKWLNFSGKLMGAVAVRKLQLTVPPFHPNRILSEDHFIKSGNGYKPVNPESLLHGLRTSEQNLNLYLDRRCDDALLFWHGTTQEHMPQMIYRITATREEAWYISLEADGLKIGLLRGISRTEADRILSINTAEQAAAANP